MKKGMWLAKTVFGPIQQIEFLRVLEMLVSHCAYDCTETLCRGETTFYKYIHDQNAISR